MNVATLGIFGALTGMDGSGDPGTNSCAGALGAALQQKAPQSAGDKILQGVGSAAEGVGEGTINVIEGVGKGIGEGLNNLFGN